MPSHKVIQFNIPPDKIKDKYTGEKPSEIVWHERHERFSTHKERQGYLKLRGAIEKDKKKNNFLLMIKSVYADRILLKENIHAYPPIIRIDQSELAPTQPHVQQPTQEETEVVNNAIVAPETPQLTEKTTKTTEPAPSPSTSTTSNETATTSTTTPTPSPEKKKEKPPLKVLFSDPTYYPQDECSSDVPRLLLDSDIRVVNVGKTPESGAPIQVFCDISAPASDVAFSAAFDYIEESKYIIPLNWRMEMKELTVCCDCRGFCEPDTCACYKMNVKCFGEFMQHTGAGVIVDSYDYLANGTVRNHHDSFLFMCGDLCKCNSKKCNNHVNNLKRTDHRFEVFRANENIGFGVRVLNSMHVGDVICEVVGSVISSKETGMDEYKRSYSMTLYDVQRQAGIEHLFVSSGYESKKYRDILNEFKGVNWYINMLYDGNISRFVNHSCMPNVAPFRVVANYLHPAFHRLFLMAVSPIQLGTELTMKYDGNMQIKNFDCLCKTPFCTELSKTISKELHVMLTEDEFVNELSNYYETLDSGVAYNSQLYQQRIDKHIDYEEEHIELYEPEEFVLKQESPELRKRNKDHLVEASKQVPIKVLRTIQEDVCVAAELALSESKFSGYEKKTRLMVTSKYNKEYIKYEGDIERIKQGKVEPRH